MAPKASPEKKVGEGNKKWTDAVEHDLVMVVLATSTSGSGIKVNWPDVYKAMKVLGYDFSDSAINQKFGKTILRSFREKHGKDVLTRIAAATKDTDGGPVTAPAPTPRKKSGSAASTPGSKRKKANNFTPVNSPGMSGKKGAEFSEEGDDDDVGIETPTKKFKAEAKAEAKADAEAEAEVQEEFELDPEFANDKPIQFGVFLKQESRMDEV